VVEEVQETQNKAIEWYKEKGMKKKACAKKTVHTKKAAKKTTKKKR
jgi:hypothetical protein